MEKIYYLDNASTTKVFDVVFDIIKSENEVGFYNPSASYKQSILVKKKLDEARANITQFLGGSGGKLYFTSSATESNNTVFSGVHLRSGQVVLISAGEHPSVYSAAHKLEKNGIRVVDIPLDRDGRVDREKFASLLQQENVALVSVIHVSNETGVVNDIKGLVKLAKQINPKIIFHSDGVQAFGKIKFSLKDLGVDLYTVSAHKLYAPRGIAGLWVKSGVLIDPLLVGGGQESGFRSSTENVAGALAFNGASKIALDDFDRNYEAVKSLKDELIEKLMKSKINEKLKINSQGECSPYILSLSFAGIKGEVLMYALETDGILISTGSACSSKKAGNRVLEAMGLNQTEVVGSIRISFSPYCDYDIDYIVSCLEKNILRLYANVKR